MITNGLAEEHWHSIQAKFYAILTKTGNYTRIFVGETFGQSVSKVMTHLAVFGEFSSIPNLGKTSPPPPCTMLTRHEMTIVPERVINIDWGGGGKFGKRCFFLAVVRRSSRKFQNFAECVTSFATDCSLGWPWITVEAQIILHLLQIPNSLHMAPERDEVFSNLCWSKRICMCCTESSL